MKKQSKKAQALVELGIMASLMILAIGTMATFIAKLNSDQYIQMESFRRALKKAHDENKLIAYGMWDDRRMVDANMPIIGSKNTHSAAGFVHWSVPSVLENSNSTTQTTLPTGPGGDGCEGTCKGAGGSNNTGGNASNEGNAGESPESELYVAINSPPAMMGMNEYKADGGGIAPTYLTFTAENVTVTSSGHATGSVRSAGVGEFMQYEVGNQKVFQARGYGGARPLGASN
jgi:hypothetical protein